VNVRRIIRNPAVARVGRPLYVPHTFKDQRPTTGREKKLISWSNDNDKHYGDAAISHAIISARIRADSLTDGPKLMLFLGHPSCIRSGAAARCLGAGDGGQVGLRDLLLVMARVAGEEVWRAVFDKFDMDGDGFVTPAEYRAMMTQIYGGQPPTDDEVNATFNAADHDRDGRIGYDGCYIL